MIERLSAALAGRYTVEPELGAGGMATVFVAQDAALKYGRGRNAAALDFGDCVSDALSVARGEPLLFVGIDLARTDVEVCA